MGLLDDILKQIQGGVAQANPFDGGQDYRSVTRPQAQAQAPQQHQVLMQVGPNGQAMRSNQGNIAPAQQQDTWLQDEEQNTALGNFAGMQALSNLQYNRPMRSPQGNSDSWDLNSPDAIYKPTNPRSQSTFRY